MATQTLAPPEQLALPTGFKKWIIVITAISAAIIELIDTSIVNVGLTDIAGNLGVTVEDVSWVVTAYAIANVIVIPMTGFLQRYFGRKDYYVGSIILFTIASYGCGFADNLWTLVAFRFLQGIGGGALLSTSQGLMFDSFAPSQRPLASALVRYGYCTRPNAWPYPGWLYYRQLPLELDVLY